MTAAAKKSFGQHFLADPNILGVIGRLAELETDDIVLEIGPGLGVLTTFLADRVSLVHAVEVDRELESHLPGPSAIVRTFDSSLVTRCASISRHSLRRRESWSRTSHTTSQRR